MHTVRLRLDHTADSDVLRDRFIELARADEGVIEHDQIACYVTDHNAQGMEISFYAMSPDPSTGWAAEMRLREGLLRYIRNHHPDWWPQERVEGGALVPASEG